MKTPAKKRKRWSATPVQNLVRHESGVYYARLQSAGKEIWRSLRTEIFEVAKVKLGAVVEEERKRTAGREVPAGRMLVRDAEALRLRQVENDPSLKPATRHYWRQCFALLFRTWPELRERPVARVTKAECEGWAGRVAGQVSPTRFNNVLSALRQIFEVAVEGGARYGNPAAGIKRRRIPRRQLDLPGLEQFQAWVAAMRGRGGRFSRHCADFVEVLAYSGIRKGEAARLTWRDADFGRGELVVRGDPATGTKNWQTRRVPMTPPLRELLLRMKAERIEPGPDERVCVVREAQKCMDLAARDVGMDLRLTHHQLRHFYATTCIEAGVDVPTVSRWLGHGDGGALAMRTYGHARREHAQGAALKVTFGKGVAS